MPNMSRATPTKPSRRKKAKTKEVNSNLRSHQDDTEPLLFPRTKGYDQDRTTNSRPLQSNLQGPPEANPELPKHVTSQHCDSLDSQIFNHSNEDKTKIAGQGPPSPTYAEVAGKPKPSRASTLVAQIVRTETGSIGSFETPPPIFATLTPTCTSLDDHLEFCNPFHKNQPTVYLASSHRGKFGTEFAESVHSLRALDVEQAQKTRDHMIHKGFGEVMEIHRERLCKAVASWGWHGNGVESSFCDYSSRRKSAAAETTPAVYELQGAPTATVPLQRFHKGPYTIPRDKANVKFSDVNQLLYGLNDVLGTEYTIERPGLQACLQGYLDESCDFGQIYGHLRPWWAKDNFHRIAVLMQQRKEEDAQLRKNAVDGDCIVNPHIPPRRIWDLYSNRVLPFHVLPVSSPSTIPANVWAVSHSWKEASKRRARKTRVNGKAWAVPLPLDTDLHGVRIELLNLGAEYVFLDVLCLRQNDPQTVGQEFRRKKEWRLDVPTIGYVYQPLRVTVVYFNGLGEEFLLAPPGGLESPCHWFMRVWTLQEATQYWLPGGLTHKSLDISIPRPHMQSFYSRLRDVLQPTTTASTSDPDLFRTLAAIRDRRFSSPVDSIAGLAYPLRCKTLPIYNADMDLEDAWEALVQSMSPFQRLTLLICWRGPGDSRAGGYTWRPTWRQVTDYHHLYMSGLHLNLSDTASDPRAMEDEFVQFLPNAGHQDGSDAYFHYAYVIKTCFIQTSPDGYVSDSSSVSTRSSDSEDEDTEGYESSDTARVSSHTSVDTTASGACVEVRAYGRKYTYKIARLGAPLSRPRDKYTLVGVCGRRYWIVGRASGSRRIGTNRGAAIALSKVAVLELDASAGTTPEKDNLGHVDMVVYR